MKTRIPCLIQFERQTLCMKYNSPSRVRTVTQRLTQHHHYPTPPKRRYFFLPNISWLLHEVRPTTEEWETPDGPASQALTTSQRIRLAYGDTLIIYYSRTLTKEGGQDFIGRDVQTSTLMRGDEIHRPGAPL